MSEKETSARRLKGFLPGLIIGGALGAATAFLLASPMGRNIVRSIGQEGFSLSQKGLAIARTAKDRSIDLTKKVSSAGKRGNEEEQVMIPIPRDFV